jgi:hypothetical protein
MNAIDTEKWVGKLGTIILMSILCFFHGCGGSSGTHADTKNDATVKDVVKDAAVPDTAEDTPADAEGDQGPPACGGHGDLKDGKCQCDEGYRRDPKNPANCIATMYTAPLPTVKICQKGTFTQTVPIASGALSHDCTACTDTANFCKYANPGNPDDPNDDNEIIEFVIEETAGAGGLGGFLRINTGSTGERMAFYHPGAGSEGGGACRPPYEFPGFRWSDPYTLAINSLPGTSLVDPPIANELAKYGIQTVSVNYLPGYYNTILYDAFLKCMGWLTRTTDEPWGLDRLAARPAALMKWVHDNLSNGRKYEVIGNGGGAAATYIAQYWIDPDGDGQGLLEEFADHVTIIGMPVFWDFKMACGEPDDTVKGICENDFEKSCTSDADCGGTPNRCALEYKASAATIVLIPVLLDYINNDPLDSCYMRRNNEVPLPEKIITLLENSSLRHRGGDTSIPYSIAFHIADHEDNYVTPTFCTDPGIDPSIDGVCAPAEECKLIRLGEIYDPCIVARGGWSDMGDSDPNTGGKGWLCNPATKLCQRCWYFSSCLRLDETVMGVTAHMAQAYLLLEPTGGASKTATEWSPAFHGGIVNANWPGAESQFFIDFVNAVQQGTK